MPIGNVLGQDTISVAAGGTQTLTVQQSNLRSHCAFIQVRDNPITFTLDGSTPSASVGVEVGVNGTIELTTSEQVRRFKAFGNGAGASELEVVYGQQWLPG